MNKKLIIGLGTGRSGTKSLTELLNKPRGSLITHECRPVLPWEFHRDLAEAKMHQLMGRKAIFVGDVSLYFLNYVPWIAEHYPTVRFVCMQRPRDATVASYMRFSRNRNMWQRHDGSVYRRDPEWDACYPKYPITITKEEAIGRYWDDYYAQAEQFQRTMSSFRIFPLDALNHANGTMEIERHVAS